MNLAELEATNTETLRLLRERTSSVDPIQHPYRGYYTVELFELPTVPDVHEQRLPARLGHPVRGPF